MSRARALRSAPTRLRCITIHLHGDPKEDGEEGGPGEGSSPSDEEGPREEGRGEEDGS